MPPPQRAKPARKSVRCRVGDGSPRPQPPHPQPVGSGPRSHARADKWSGVGERPTPDTPHPGRRRPPLGTLMPRPERAKPARKSARCGIGDGSPCQHPPQSQPMGSGPRPHAREDEWSGVGERPTPDTPHPGRRRPSLGTLMPRPERAKPARKSARCGIGDGSPCQHPPHSQPMGSGPRPHARKDEWSGVRERPTPDAPHPGRRRPPRAPSCRPHSAQSQLARARAVGLLTGPHARTPRTQSHRVVGPGRTLERTSGRGWESARPRTPHAQARGAPPGHLHANPTARKASSQECALWVGDGSLRPQPPHPQPVGSGPRPHARKDEWSGVGERPGPAAPQPGRRRPPRAPSCRPYSAPSQRARPARKSARCGVGDGSLRPQPPHPQPVGSGPRPHARKDEWSGVGERPGPAAPQPGKRRPPRAPSCRPYSVPSQRARPARRRARGWVGDGSPRPHPPHGERAAPSQVGGNGTGPPPPKQAKRSTGLRPGTRRGTDRVERPYQRPAPGPREVRAPHQPGERGGGADAARARAHTHTKDTRGKPEGQLDRVRGTHRPHGMAYQLARIRDTQTGRPATNSAGSAGRAGGNREDTTPGTGPNPPEPAANAADTRPGHCTCQGSSDA